MIKKILLLVVMILSILDASAQNATIRGFVYNEQTGDPITSALITFATIKQGGYSDERGLYSVVNIAPGKYTAVVTLVGYDTAKALIELRSGQVLAKNFYLNTASNTLGTIRVSAEKIRKTKEINISKTTISPVQLTKFPSVGGEPDLVQYLQVLPGVVFSGDQGGQLYIRGGSPVMNRVMLDGLTIYNPFHSIGLFSVFDSDILKSVDVYSAGFNSEYGGRISAIVDVKTRDGNKKELAGKINASPFSSKFLLEGPLKKYKPGKGSSSFILSYKNSYLNKTSPSVYPYAAEGSLPYSFSDLYGKISINSSKGSEISFFGFDFTDDVAFEQSAAYNWRSSGLGTEFLLVPGGSQTIIDGSITYSGYEIMQTELDQKPRRSGINGFNVNLNFSRFLGKLDNLKYGVEMNGFSTDFELFNSLNRRITQKENTSEVSAFVNYLKNFNKKFLLETGLRLQRYASLSETTLEPRVGMKYNINTRWRLKGSAGIYSQNLMSAVSDRDVVNLFYGFLSGPTDLPNEFLGKPVDSKLQKARHAVFGVEFDINAESEVNVEGYLKSFTQITNINRDKIFDDNRENQFRPYYLRENFIIENGEAYGFDVTYKYENKKLYVWTVYSFNVVNRFDGIRKYQPHFDRRHNMNIVTSYDFGENNCWSSSIRWNFGSGFPFTLTQGFYEQLDFSGGASTDFLSENGDLGINYAEINQGVLPYYHRLDVSTKRRFKWKNNQDKERNAELIFSVTNIYNRENIFYFDRVNYKRENQLPILPSISASYSF
jgi:hypothetical protein